MPLDGVSDGTSITTGVLETRLAGTSTGTSSTTGAVLRTIGLTGTSTGSSTTTGALSAELAGTTIGASTTVGTLGTLLAGTSAAASTTAGMIATRLAGTTTGTAATAGTLLHEALLAGTSDATGTTVGATVQEYALASVSAGSSTMTGVVVVPLSAFSVGASDETATLNATYALGGTSVGGSNTGWPNLPGVTQFPSPALYPGFLNADLARNIGLSGTSVGTSTMTAGETILAGTSIGSSATGYSELPGATQFPDPALYPGLQPTELARQVTLTGTTTGGSSTTGTALVAFASGGTSTGSASTTGDLRVTKAYAVVSVGTGTTTGALFNSSEAASFAGTSFGHSATGYPRLPAITQLPNPGLYPGLGTTELSVSDTGVLAGTSDGTSITVGELAPIITLRMLEGDDGGPGLVDTDSDATMIEAGSRAMTLVGS